MKIAASLFLFTIFALSSASAQMPPNLENGFKHWGSFEGSNLDTIDNLNGNQMLHAPLLPNYGQRGNLSMQIFLYQTSKSWQVSCTVHLNNETTCQWTSGRSGVDLREADGLAVQRTLQQNSSGTGTTSYNAFGYTIQDASGGTHQLVGTGTKDSTSEFVKFDSIDTSGYHLDLSNPDAYGIMTTATVTDRHGKQYIANNWAGGSETGPAMCPQLGGNRLPSSTVGGMQIGPIIDDAPLGVQDCPQFSYASQVTDSNGNRITDPSTGGTDTMGRTFAFFNGGQQTADYSDCVSGHTISYATILSYNAPDSTTRHIKLCYGNIPISTSFNVSGIVENTGTSAQELVTVVLADGTKWKFDYDSYGEATFIGLPSGGSISYTWTTIAFPSCAPYDGGVSRAVATRTMNDNNGHSYLWTYNWGTVQPNKTISNTVTDPLLNDTTHIFTALDSGCSFYETTVQQYQGTGGSRHLMKQVDTTFSKTLFAIETDASGLGNVVPTNIQTTVYPSGKVNQVQKTYAPPVVTGGPIYGNVATEKTYDWGPSSAPLTEIDTTYQWQVNGAYLTSNMLDLPSSIITKDGSGNRVAETDYSYDESAYFTNITPVISTQHFSPPNTVRGNETTVSHWLNTTNGFISGHTNWYDTGEVYQKIDPLGHTITYSYDPAYVGAYVTQTCSPSTGGTGHCVSGTYDFNTGVLTSLTNENATAQAAGNTPGDSAHTSNFVYDYMFRITSAQEPPDSANGGARLSTGFSFSAPNTFPLSVQRTKSITNALSDTATSFFDGLGRGYQSQHVLPGGTSKVDTTFDGAGHVATVSNPYFSTSDLTYGKTTSLYDALGRAIQITKQDGSISSVSYDQAVTGVQGSCTTTTDEAGKQRRACSDAMGRLVEVDEPGGSSPGVQATASIVVSGAFNSTSVSASPMHPAATGTAMTSVTMTDGSSHTFYLDTNQHLCHLFWNTTGGWQNQDLTDQTESGSALIGSSISAASSGSAVHVFYQGANQHIYNMEWTGTAWQNLDLTTLAGATAISGTKLSAVVFGVNSPTLFYEGTNQHFYIVYWAASASVWANADMSSITGQTTLMATNSSVSSGYYGSGFYGFYLGTNQHLITIYWSGSAWATADVTTLSGGALATAGSALTTLSLSAGSTPLMTFYEGPSQHVYSIYWTTSSVWQTLDFTSFSGATNIAAAATAFTNSNPSIQAFYFGSNQHLDDINWNGSAWVNSDLTSLSSATVTAAAGSSLSAHGTSGGNTYHVFTTGVDQHIYDTYYTPSPAGWHNVDLFALATNYVIDTGIVSLAIPNGTSNFTATVCYGSSVNPFCAGKPINASPSDIASALAGVLNGTGSPVTAVASGATLNLTWRATGEFTVAVASMTSVSDNPSLFPSGSFTSTESSFSNGIAVGSQVLTSPQVTQYQYDALGNLLRVDQKGSAPSDNTQWRTRTFIYDSLSRLLTATNPESGTIGYSYDADGNLLQKTSPAPNQTGTATQTVSYCYDELHRVTGKGYGAQSCPLASPVVSYTYDSGANAKGKLVSLIDQAGTATYGYDTLGRLITETRTLTGASNASISKSMSYEYYLGGSIYKLHYPSGAAVTYTPGAAGLTLSAVDGGNGINYATGATYGPDSAITGFVSGYSGTFAGITNAFAYNKRLQPLTMSATAPSQTIYSIGYDFHVGNGTIGNDNGNVWGITNYKDANRSQSFTYDSLNRLTSAQNAGTNCTVATVNGKTEYWGNSYGYDAWGNLLQKSVTKCGAENLSVTADGHNWIHASGTDYQYDAAGNMTYDATASLSYTFDQENRITGAGGYTYTYDGDGNRARKSNGNLAANGTLYWAMTPGIVAETDLAGTTKSEYVFFGGERVARRDGANGAGGVFYYFSDHLKTASVVTDSAGTIKAESDFYPWGGELQFTNNDSNHYKFTGKERDAESGLDYFGARYYSGGLGRWVSADWSATPVPVPYADFGDPQSLNLYGYVRGLPTVRIDADGHCCDWQAAWDFGTGVVRGVVSSASSGSVGAPSSSDSNMSLGGQSYGTLLEGAIGSGIAIKGAGDAGTGLALAIPTEGGSLVLVAEGAGEAAVGSYMAAGAAKNSGAILNAMASKNSTGGSATHDSTPENVDRMKDGKAPTGNDGHPVELHHEGQTNGSGKPMTRTEHRLGENFKKNHPNTGQEKSQINRSQAAKQRQQYWKDQAKKQDQK